MKNNSRLRTAFILTLLFCLFVLSFTIFLSHNNIKSFFNCITLEQEVLVNEKAKQLDEYLASARFDDTTREKLVEIMKQAEVSNSRYWLLGTSDQIIFFQDEKTTELYKGKTFTKLLKEYQDKGGKNIDEMKALIQAETGGSVQFSRSRNAGEEILSLNVFKVGNQKYMVGVSTTEQYFFSLTDIYRDRIYLYALIGLLCSVIFILVIHFMLELQKKERVLDENCIILQGKNRQIEELNQRISSRSCMNIGNQTIYDQFTNLYSKQFFFAVLDNALKEQISPVSIILIHMRVPYYDLSVNQIKEAADLLKGFVSESSILARIEYNDFALILVNTGMGEAYELAAEVERRIEASFDDISADIQVKDIGSLVS